MGKMEAKWNLRNFLEFLEFVKMESMKDNNEELDLSLTDSWVDVHFETEE